MGESCVSIKPTVESSTNLDVVNLKDNPLLINTSEGLDELASEAETLYGSSFNF